MRYNGLRRNEGNKVVVCTNTHDHQACNGEEAVEEVHGGRGLGVEGNNVEKGRKDEGDGDIAESTQ